MKEGGVLLIEGAVIDLNRTGEAVPTPANGVRVPSQDCFARFYYRESFCGDSSNWWVPTVPCLKQWVECNYFEVTREYDLWPVGHENTRSTLLARAVCRKDPQYMFPDPDLEMFNQTGR
jgi:hypothetical protein